MTSAEFYGRRDLEKSYFYAAAGGRGAVHGLPSVEELADILCRHSSLINWREKAEAVLNDIRNADAKT